jgi:hypothetical protein
MPAGEVIWVILRMIFDDFAVGATRRPARGGYQIREIYRAL